MRPGPLCCTRNAVTCSDYMSFTVTMRRGFTGTSWKVWMQSCQVTSGVQVLIIFAQSAGQASFSKYIWWQWTVNVGQNSLSSTADLALWSQDHSVQQACFWSKLPLICCMPYGSAVFWLYDGQRYTFYWRMFGHFATHKLDTITEKQVAYIAAAGSRQYYTVPCHPKESKGCSSFDKKKAITTYPSQPIKLRAAEIRVRLPAPLLLYAHRSAKICGKLIVVREISKTPESLLSLWLGSSNQSIIIAGNKFRKVALASCTFYRMSQTVSWEYLDRFEEISWTYHIFCLLPRHADWINDDIDPTKLGEFCPVGLFHWTTGYREQTQQTVICSTDCEHGIT